jgi:putative Ca2+/H+ antiporter (TMEM165/GDT1 family)
MEAVIVSIASVALPKWATARSSSCRCWPRITGMSWPILAGVLAGRCGRLSRTLPANAPKLGRRDAFLSTLIAFLIAEIGDQTQMPLWHAPPAMPIWLR